MIMWSVRELGKRDIWPRRVVEVMTADGFLVFKFTWNCKVQVSDSISVPISTHAININDKKMCIDMYN